MHCMFLYRILDLERGILWRVGGISSKWDLAKVPHLTQPLLYGDVMRSSYHPCILYIFKSGTNFCQILCDEVLSLIYYLGDGWVGGCVCVCVCVCARVCVCVCKGLAVSELSTWPLQCDISYPTGQGGRMALCRLLGMSTPTIHSEIRKVLQMGLQAW